MGQNMIQRFQNGFIPWNRSNCLFESKDKTIWMKSTWEVLFAEWLDDFEYTWWYEPKSFLTKFGYYLPDFFVADWNCYIEIKGWRQNVRLLKLGAFRNRYRMENIKLFRRNKLIKMGVLV